MSIAPDLIAQETDLYIIQVNTATTYGGSTNSLQFRLPMYGTADYSVDWEYDGTFAADTTTTEHNILNTYAAAGVKTIAVRTNSGNPRINFNGGGDRLKLTSIDQWGTAVWESVETAYMSCSNMNVAATDAPDLSNATSTSQMFQACTKLNSANLNTWDIGTITDFSNMFHTCTIFNSSLADWNIGENTGTDDITMQSMFQACYSFNQPLETWETNANSTMAYVNNMQNMFYTYVHRSHNRGVFNQPLGAWDVGRNTNFVSMFMGQQRFNAALEGWNISENTGTDPINMASMFRFCTGFNQPLEGWETDANSTMAYVSTTNNMFAC